MQDRTWSNIVWIMAIVIMLLILLFSKFEKVESSEGTSLKGQQGAVTFQHTAACSAVVLWMGKDTTSWEVDSIDMSACFSSDSKLWCYEPTLNYSGDYFVKVKYYTPATSAVGYFLADHWFVSDVQTGISNNRDTIFVLETSDSTAISGVTLTIYPDGGGKPSAQISTDANGTAIIGLPDGDYDAYPFKQGWDFSATDLSISGDQTDTIWGTAFSSTPTLPGYTTIRTWLLTSAGDTISPSYVKWRLVDTTASNGDGKPYNRGDRLTSGTGVNTILHDKEWHTVTADSGYISFNLVPNSNIYVNGVLDTSSYYQFEGDYNGNITWYIGQVSGSSFNPFAQ